MIQRAKVRSPGVSASSCAAKSRGNAAVDVADDAGGVCFLWDDFVDDVVVDDDDE